MIRECPKCGYELFPLDKECDNCGEPVESTNEHNDLKGKKSGEKKKDQKPKSSKKKKESKAFVETNSSNKKTTKAAKTPKEPKTKTPPPKKETNTKKVLIIVGCVLGGLIILGGIGFAAVKIITNRLMSEYEEFYEDDYEDYEDYDYEDYEDYEDYQDYEDFEEFEDEGVYEEEFNPEDFEEDIEEVEENDEDEEAEISEDEGEDIDSETEVQSEEDEEYTEEEEEKEGAENLGKTFSMGESFSYDGVRYTVSSFSEYYDYEESLGEPDEDCRWYEVCIDVVNTSDEERDADIMGSYYENGEEMETYISDTKEYFASLAPGESANLGMIVLKSDNASNGEYTIDVGFYEGETITVRLF